MKRLGFLMVAAALTAACSGGDSSSSSPTSPATAATAAANGSSGTSADGAGSTGTAAGAATIGTISGLSGACPSVTFKLEAKTIKTDAATTYPEKGCADLKNGVRVGVTGTAQADGSILAKQVKFAPPPPPPPALTEGTVSALSGACPTITFTVAGKTFTADAQTRFGDGGCAAVTNGAKVVVQTQAPTAGAVRVLAVKVIPPPPPPPALTEGTVSALSGACPTITFTAAGKTFTTDAQTRFGDGGCAAVIDGAKVLVQTQATTAGAVRVLGVKVIPPPPPPPALTEGTVSALSGACPAITFTVAGKTFTADAQTRFGDGGCAAVTNGAKVVVQTQAPTAGAVRVLAVKVIPPPPPPPALTGEVTAVSGSCPAITITLGAKVAVTNAATVFTGKTCADVKVGSKVGIYGTIAAGATTLTATKVVVR
jgi:hypothetical protein